MNTKVKRTDHWAEVCASKRALFERCLEVDTFHSCINCENFDVKNDVCSLVGTRPPTDVIVFSCGKAWVGFLPF
jgi:hypothetical protein